MKKLIAFVLGLFITLPAMATLPQAAINAGYTEVEYIEKGIGNYYIDTGFVPKNNTKLEYVATILSYDGETGNSYSYLFGNWGNTSDQARFNMDINLTSSKSWEFGIGTGTWTPGTNGYTISPITSISLNEKHTIIYDNRTVYIDGELIKSLTGDVDVNTLNFYIGSANKPAASAGNYTGMAQRIYSVKLWNGSTLARDFVPVKNSSGVYGMYNILDSNPATGFYSSRGTGTFTGGNPVCPNGGTLQTYTSATGTGTQSPDPTPDAPVTPTFYTQGDMVLRKVGNYADSYDATTGKITRRVAVVVFDGTESWAAKTPGWEHGLQGAKTGSDGLMLSHFGFRSVGWNDVPVHYAMRSGTTFRINYPEATTVAELKSWLAEQYAAGTPVTVWYPLATAVEEDWAETSYCQSPIKIATTKYNNTAFSGVVTALSNAVDTIKTVVANTINQATAVANLHSGKQTKPTDTCPNGKICLLVEDEAGTPHWYEIIERAPGIVPAGSGYTQVEYLQSDGNQYIDTGVKTGSATSYGYDLTYQYTELLSGTGNGVTLLGIRQTNPEGGWGNLYWANYAAHPYGRSIFGGLPNSVIQYFGDATNTTTVYTTSFDANKTTRAWSITDSVSGSFSGTLDRPFDCSDLNVYLFRFNPGTQTPNQLPKARVYHFTMRVDGNVVRDFVPARRNSDGVLGMYDTVSGNFFTNAGTGKFYAPDSWVPNTYTRLEYIENTGTQYIDTGIIPDYTQYSYSWQFKMNNSEPAMFMGANGNMLIRYENGRYSIAGGQVSVPYTLNTDLIAELNVAVGGARSGTVNGTSLTGSNASQQNNIYIFNLGSQAGFATAGKIYYSKIYRNGSVIQDLVPAKRNSDNELGMYDTVSGQFFTNRGTGTFTAGPVAQ